MFLFEASLSASIPPDCSEEVFRSSGLNKEKGDRLKRELLMVAGVTMLFVGVLFFRDDPVARRRGDASSSVPSSARTARGPASEIVSAPGPAEQAETRSPAELLRLVREDLNRSLEAEARDLRELVATPYEAIASPQALALEEHAQRMAEETEEYED